MFSEVSIATLLEQGEQGSLIGAKFGANWWCVPFGSAAVLLCFTELTVAVHASRKQVWEAQLGKAKWIKLLLSAKGGGFIEVIQTDFDSWCGDWHHQVFMDCNPNDSC